MPIILLVLGGILIFLNIKTLKKDKKSFENVLKCKKEDISDVEVQIGAIRKDMAESLTELQMEIVELKTSIEKLQSKVIENVNENNMNEDDEVDERAVLLNEDTGVINEIGIKNKRQQIQELLELGLNENEICEKLSLGKGEVLLVKGLYKK